MITSVLAARRFISAPAWKDYIIRPYEPLADVVTVPEIENFIRQNSGAMWHGERAIS
jgi:hypothetical protein